MIEHSPRKYRVSGYVVFESGRPAAGLALRAYLHRPGVVEPVARCETNSDGHYEFDFESQFRAMRLEVKAVGCGEGQAELSLCTPKPVTDPTELLNLVAPRVCQRSSPEWHRLTADLSRELGPGVSLGDLREDEERQDLSLLRDATGWDARAIALAIAATRRARETAVPAGALYGLFRAGMSTSSSALAWARWEDVHEGLEAAVRSGMIGRDDVLGAEESLKSYRRAQRSSFQPAEAVSSNRDLIDGCGLSENEKDAFEGAFFDNDGPVESLWPKLRSLGFSEQKVDSLRLQGRLVHLTSGNAALAASLRKHVSSVDSLVALVDQDLHRSETWSARLNALSENEANALERLIPRAIAGRTLAERRDAYAAEMARRIRVSFPTQVVRRILETGDLKLGRHEQHRDVVAMVLRRAEIHSFQLGQVPLRAFVREHQDELLAGLDPEKAERTLRALEGLQRTYQIAPSNHALGVLLDLGYDSAHEVASIPHDAFVARHGGRFSSKEEASLVYRKAQQVASVALAMLTNIRLLEATPSVQAMSGNAKNHVSSKKKAKQTLGEHFRAAGGSSNSTQGGQAVAGGADTSSPETLLGSLDFCECEHCRSVLSPAAYFVDLLKYLDPSANDWKEFKAEWQSRHGTAYTSGTPYDELAKRRPDLPHLQLTCENTNTVLPYIDVVNEVLEYYVAHDKLDPNAARDTGVGVTSAELLAEPENVIAEVYNAKLKQARYPLTLPFDLWTESARRFLEHFETPLWRVLDVFRSTDDLFVSGAPYDRATIFAEQLGISPSEYVVFTAAQVHSEWFELYGYVSSATASNELRFAKNLSRKLGATYQELVELLGTWFVNPDLEALVTLRKLDVTAEDVFRYKDASGHAPMSAAERTAFEDALQEGSAGTFDAKTWVDQLWTDGKLDSVVVLADPTMSCNFDQTTLSRKGALDNVLLRLNLFVRLWRKLGWSIEETDRALHAFVPRALTETELGAAELGPALATALVYLAHLETLTSRLKLGKNAKLKALTFWSDLSTTGKTPLYGDLFLNKSILATDPIFDDPAGAYLTQAEPLAPHMLALQGALELTAEEATAVLEHVGTSVDSVVLSVATLSVLYRYRLLSRALGWPVGEVLALERLSGLRPFTPLPDGPLVQGAAMIADPPFSQTLRFIEVAENLAANDLSVEDVEYLLVHRFDPVGKYRQQPASLLALVRTTCAELERTRTEHPDLASPELLTDEILRQKLALVLPQQQVDTFMALWRRPDPASAKVLFDGYLVNSTPTVGFLEVADFAAVFAPIPKDADGNDVEGSTLEEYFNLKRGVLRKRLLPFVRKRFVQERIVQAVASSVGAEPKLVDVLLTSAKLLSHPAESGTLLEAFEKAANQGVTTTFILPGGLSELERREAVRTTEQDRPGDAIGVRFDCFLEVPNAGPYSFFVAISGAPATTRLRITDIADQEVQLIDESFTLHAGLPYRMTFEVDELGDGEATLEVQAENLPRAPLSIRTHVESSSDKKADSLRLVLYPADAVERVARLKTLVEKTLTLIRVFDLTEPALQDLGVDFSKLPTDLTVSAPAQSPAAFFGDLLRLFEHARLRREIDTNTDDLIAIHTNAKAPNALLEEVCASFAALTRRDKTTVLQAAKAMPFPTLADTFGDARGVLRIWDALQLAEQLGVPVATIAHWTKPTGGWEVDSTLAHEIRNAIKARFEADAWLRVAQPIFDQLRQRKRDALVSYLFDRVAHPDGEKAETIERLFDTFLLDPGMEPVVQTSRLRLAISCVQTFVQRCFLNLENEVSPSALRADHWEWMKRYRVWEANRKIFLFAHNWLEPEWRDDKTYMCRTLEGMLLQGDVSDELAEQAFSQYLRELEEVARLEVVSMFYDEKVYPESSALHLVGRTFSSPRRYFHRTRKADQTWTPWEPVGAEVEGDHVVVVVWRSRLHVFWLTYLETPKPHGGAINLKQLEEGGYKIEAPPAEERNLQVQVHWTELYEGEWTPAVSSRFNMPDNVAQDFDKRWIKVGVSEEANGADHDGALVVSWQWGNAIEGSFRLVSKNFGPIPKTTAAELSTYPYAFLEGEENQDDPTRKVGQVNFSLDVDPTLCEAPQPIFGVDGGTTFVQCGLKPILAKCEDRFLFLGCDNPVSNVKRVPFFLEDSRHTLFVEPIRADESITAHERAPAAKRVAPTFNRQDIQLVTETLGPWQKLDHPIGPQARYRLVGTLDMASRKDS